MKICVIGPTHPFRGGIANYTTLLTDALREENEVLLISFSRQYPLWLFPGGDDKDPSQDPFTTSAEFLIDSINPLTWIQTVWRIRRFKPEVMILQWWVPFWAPLTWFISNTTKHIKSNPQITFVVHNALPHEPKIWDRILTQIALARGDKFITHAKSEAERLRTVAPDQPIVVTHMPSFELSKKKVQYSINLPYPKDKPLLLFCGLIRPYKGLDILLNAMPHVLKAHETHLAIVGEIWGGDTLYHNQIAALDLSEYVTLENEYVPNERLYAWIKSADLVVLPYRTATQSAIARLALDLGAIVIATRVGGLTEIIDDGVNGVLVSPECSQSLANAIISQINQPLTSKFRPELKRSNIHKPWSELTALLTS